MSKKITTNLIISAIILGSIFISGVIIYSGKNSQSGTNLPNNAAQLSNTISSKYSTETLGTFAKCLNEKGLVFYGAWWCPHCDNQKALFGAAFQYVNYVECEKNPGQSRGQLVDACVKANIKAYPTWIFKDGTRETGELPLETLSELSSCELK